jgi:uncharacterized membrane protein YjjP (DUF1212 family)
MLNFVKDLIITVTASISLSILYYHLDSESIKFFITFTGGIITGMILIQTDK